MLARIKFHLELAQHRRFHEQLLERRAEDLQSSQHEIQELLRSLRDSEAKLRGFTQNASQAFSLKDTDGRYLMVNRAAATRAGYRSEEMLGRTNRELRRWLDDETREEIDAHEREVVDSGVAVIRQRTEVERDGNAYTLLVNKFPVFDPSGEVVSVGTINTDITDQQVAEHALRETHERFQDFAEASSDWFWELDEELRFIQTSELDVSSLSFAALEALDITRPGSEHTDVGAHPEKWQRFWRDLETHQPIRSFEFPIRDAKGRLRHVRASAKPRFDDNGRFMGYRGVASDVTEIVESQLQAQRDVEQHENALSRLASELLLTEERERRRIAADLHDGAVQELGLSRIRLGTLRGAVAGSEFAPPVEEIRNLVSQSIRQVRSLMAELSPPMLYELGLEPALEWLTGHFRERHQLVCEMKAMEEPAVLSTNSKVALF